MEVRVAVPDAASAKGLVQRPPHAFGPTEITGLDRVFAGHGEADGADGGASPALAGRFDGGTEVPES